MLARLPGSEAVGLIASSPFTLPAIVVKMSDLWGE